MNLAFWSRPAWLFVVLPSGQWRVGDGRSQLCFSLVRSSCAGRLRLRGTPERKYRSPSPGEVNVKKVVFLLVLAVMLFLAACGSGGQQREVVNHSHHTFCKVEETSNLSIFAPWQKKTRRGIL